MCSKSSNEQEHNNSLLACKYSNPKLHQLLIMAVHQFMVCTCCWNLLNAKYATLHLQEAATVQQRMHTDLHLAYQAAGTTGAAEQHASVAPGPSSNLHHVLEEQAAFLALEQATLPEQGVSAVTQRASTEQDAPVGRSTHLMGKASHQELAPAAGQQEQGTEVISRQNSWEGRHGQLRNHSSLVNCANPEQVK